MQIQRASFACTALLGTNKAGVLKPNAEGYYTLVLGALNIFNSGGAYYPYEPAKQLFMESSSLMRRIASGSLRGEYGHPRPTGMSSREFMGRVMDIQESNVCCHIRKVWIDSASVKDENGRPVIAILGEVKPSGPMGHALQASLDNPSENVCFSIRSITNDYMVSGVTQKCLKTIVTWDYVNEPGLSVAKKWHSPALESFEEDVSIIPAHLAALRNEQARVARYAMESGNGVSAESVMADLGWTGMGDGIKNGNELILPPSAKW